MYRRLVWNDMRKSKFITLSMFLFTGLAALLISLAAILFVNLLGSIDTLMVKAKSAHFMQMHTGEINLEKLNTFALQNKNVEEYQVAEFLNIEGSDIVLKGRNFSDNVQDNGISIQNKDFDFLLDLEGNVIHVKEGELYVPIGYKSEYNLEVNEKAYIKGREFIIVGFLRDSQMNSALSSSKRFLVSKADYDELKGNKNAEYLIEFRLQGLSKISEFESQYMQAGMEANGPVVTYPLFKLLSAISDGMLIAVILFISMLVIATSFLCIRFILIARMEEDYKEIGVMKAIGIRVLDIKKIYMAKYAVISLSGCITGYLVSLLFQNVLLENIRLMIGENENSYLAGIYGVVGIILVFFLMMLYVNKVLRRFKKISTAEAIRFGRKQENSSGVRLFSLKDNKLFPVNLFLGVKDVLVRRKLYLVLLLVLIISTFIMIVPNNLYTTLSSKSFISYMGVGECDFRIDISQTDHVSSKTNEVMKQLEADHAVSKYTLLTTKAFTMTTAEGEQKSIKVELGDHTVFPLKYESGHAPVVENEIALSVMNAEELQKEIGDTITLTVDNKEKNLIVCGIYSDITNGGKTAKAAFADESGQMIWSVICAQLEEGKKVEDVVSAYKKQYDFAKVSDMDAYVKQTFGNTLNSMQTASIVAAGVAIVILLFVTVLFMKMLVVKDLYSIAIMRVIGFHHADIAKQYIGAFLFILILGLLLGTGLSNTLGEVIAGKLIQSFGVSSFQFHINPYSSYIRCPLMLAGIMLIAVVAGTKNAGKVKMAELIKE